MNTCETKASLSARTKPSPVPPLNHASPEHGTPPYPVGSLPWAAPWLLAPMAEDDGSFFGVLAFDPEAL